MPKKLTQRQKQFLIQLIDLYREMNSPIHYVELAERLDIGKITAYEMLRLLEKQGLVEAEYHLPSGKRGPGRSEVFFQPTNKAIRVFRQLSENTADVKEWEIVKQQILKKLQDGKAGEYESLLNDLLVRIPEHRSPLIFITEMVTTIILALTPIKKAMKDEGLLNRLGRIGLPGEVGLIAIAGIGVALSLVEDINLSISTLLMEQSGKYQEMYTQINKEKKKQLAEFTRNVIKIVNG